MNKKDFYIIKRYLIEEYEVQGTSRENAKKQATIQGDPYKITVLKETVKKSTK